MENTKELFIKAFMEAEKLDNEQIPCEDEIQWDFSEKFEKSMDKLIRKNNRIQLSTRRKIKTGLLAALIAVLVLFTGLMSFAATRKPIIEFTKKVFEQFNKVSLNSESTPPLDKIEIEYTLTNLPEGFELISYNSDEYRVYALWKDSNGNEISFTQIPLGSVFTVDNEYKYQELKINGFTAYLVEDEAGRFVRWTDGYYWFSISVPTDQKDYLTELEKNISEKNKIFCNKKAF